jgi:hypothetical protein
LSHYENTVCGKLPAEVTHTHTHISVVATALQQCNTRGNCLFIPQHVVRDANGILRHQNNNFSNWLREFLFSNKRVIHRVEQYIYTCQITLALNYTAVHGYMETTYWSIKCRLHKTGRRKQISLRHKFDTFVKRNDSIIVLYYRNKHWSVKQVITKCHQQQSSRHHRHQY